MKTTKQILSEFKRLSGINVADYDTTWDSYLITEEEYVGLLTSTLDELNVEYECVIKEGKELLAESWTMVAIGAVLASGKLIDLLGNLSKKISNLFRSKENKRNDKNWLERTGKKLQSKVIMYPFKLLAKLILGTVGIVTNAGVKSKILGKEYSDSDIGNQDNIDKLANTLFTVTIIAVGGAGISGAIDAGVSFTGLAEAIDSSVKLYEVFFISIAWFLLNLSSSKDKWKEYGLEKVTHQLVDCVESNGGIRKFLNIINGKSSGSDTFSCLYKGLMSGSH